MRVLVVDESEECADLLREGLERAGYEVAASLNSPAALLATIEELKPDVIVIDTESPSRDVLEHLVVLTQHTPRPVVMFASDGAPETIREAPPVRECVSRSRMIRASDFLTSARAVSANTQAAASATPSGSRARIASSSRNDGRHPGSANSS